MRQGNSPIILEGLRFAPEYPTYFEVPVGDAAAVAAMVEEGRLEYASERERGPGGSFVVAGLQLVEHSAPKPAPLLPPPPAPEAAPAPKPASPGKFSRRGR